MLPPTPSAAAYDLAAYLEAALHTPDAPKPATKDAVLAALRHIAANWDLLPSPADIGATRIIVLSGDGAAQRSDVILIDAEGRAYIEGQLPTDPERSAIYLDLRRRHLAAQSTAATSRHGAPSMSLPDLLRLIADAVCSRVRDDTRTIR